MVGRSWLEVRVGVVGGEDGELRMEGRLGSDVGGKRGGLMFGFRSYRPGDCFGGGSRGFTPGFNMTG